MSESFRFHLALSSTFALPLTTKTDHGNLFADIYAVVELPDRSPALGIKKRTVVMLIQSGLISSWLQGRPPCLGSCTSLSQDAGRAPASPYKVSFTCLFFEYMRGILSS